MSNALLDINRSVVRSQLTQIPFIFHDHFLKSDIEKQNEIDIYVKKQQDALSRYHNEMLVTKSNTIVMHNWYLNTCSEREIIRLNYVAKQQEAIKQFHDNIKR